MVIPTILKKNHEIVDFSTSSGPKPMISHGKPNGLDVYIMPELQRFCVSSWTYFKELL